MKLSKLRIIFILSITLNILFIAVFAFNLAADRTIKDTTEYNSLVHTLCQTDYQKNLQALEQQYAGDPAKVANAKNVYATTICLRNYKTGKQLDLTPLQKQVEESSPQ